ncbi:UNVERIFIED_ORG: hypothetical protein J2X79_001979 [Arthrobacter globiformis]|nr:hypothetical protein [Arthrobacter globiformis]
MKYKVATVAAAVLLTVLTACGTGTPAASTTATTTPEPTKTIAVIPDFSGKNALDSQLALTDLGIVGRFYDKDGKPWRTEPDSYVTIVRTDPAAGDVTPSGAVKLITNITPAEQVAAAAAKAKAAARAKLAARYTYTCGIGSTVPSKDFKTYKEVWKSTYYHSSSGCLLYLDGESAYDTKTLLPSEQKIVNVVAANGGDASSPGYAYAAVYTLCATDKPGYADELPAKPQWKKAEAKAALAMCPDAPHAAVLKEAAISVKIDDGNKVVGKDMDPGTWTTNPGVKDCYWSRNTGSGDIIANDMVDFAPDGVTVTVYAGEGFQSERCGVWTKIG